MRDCISAIETSGVVGSGCCWSGRRQLNRTPALPRLPHEDNCSERDDGSNGAEDALHLEPPAKMANLLNLVSPLEV
jgi:hypothetical protein